MQPGATLIRTPPDTAIAMLERGEAPFPAATGVAPCCQSMKVRYAEQGQIEAEIEGLRKRQKLVVASLHDKGLAPEEMGDGLLGAFLRLQDRPGPSS